MFKKKYSSLVSFLKVLFYKKYPFGRNLNKKPNMYSDDVLVIQ